MNKHELIAKIAADTGATKTSAAATVESLLQSITRALKKGDAITFVGFGTFKTTQRRARLAKNPRTGDAIKIPKRRVVRFTAGKALRSAVRLSPARRRAKRVGGQSVIIFRSVVAYVRTRRRVAQRLERLLDTQEVSGSIPPAPTNFLF